MTAVYFLIFVLIALCRCNDDCDNFKHGESWKEDCQTCTCFEGELLWEIGLSILHVLWRLVIIGKRTVNPTRAIKVSYHGKEDCQSCTCYEGELLKDPEKCESQERVVVPLLKTTWDSPRYITWIGRGQTQNFLSAQNLSSPLSTIFFHTCIFEY